MGKFNKKSNTQVAVPPTKSSAKKGGKRNAKEAIDKQVNAKKQKKEPIVAVVQKKKTEIKTIPNKKEEKEETSNSEDMSSSESEQEQMEEPAVEAAAVSAQPAAASKNGSIGAEVKKGKPANSSDSSDNDSDEDDKAPASAMKFNGKTVKMESSSDEDNSEESSDDEPSKEQSVKKPAKPSKESVSSDEESSEESDEEQTTKKNDSEQASAKSVKKQPKTPTTPQVETTGSKTLFVGNLSFKVEQTDVEEFFKDAGEVADVRFSSDEDGRFKGFGHVEFATEAAAQKALELNGQDLLGRAVKLDIAREKGSYTPHGNKEGNSNQKGGKSQGQTIYVRGFDNSLGEDQVRSTLEEHFGSCGEITRMSVPKDYETGAPKGIAYIEFNDSKSLSKALELNGSELGDSSITVEEARPRADNRDGGGRGRGRGGRSGGRDSGGRFGGHRGGGRRGGGGRFGGGGGRFGGGRRGR